MQCLYRHYKGGVYRVRGTARHTETGERLIIYQSKDGSTWARPDTMFNDYVYYNDRHVKRFSHFIDEKIDTEFSFCPLEASTVFNGQK
jgi:hypothetical protein